MSHAFSPQLPTTTAQKDNDVSEQKGIQVATPEHTQGTAGNGQVLVEARGLQKSFGIRQILKNVDFQMNKGDITVIIGKSGSGKSTLLRPLPDLRTLMRAKSWWTAAPYSQNRSAPRNGPRYAPRWAWCSRPTPSGRT